MQVHDGASPDKAKPRRKSKIRLLKGSGAEPDSGQELGLLRSLATRQALQIREIDHRAKNSLQLAASMLLLQARRRPDNAAARELERAVDRLHALAEIHRASYEAEEVDEIPILASIGNLCRGLVFQTGIDIDVICPDTSWPFRIAGPAGLFIGEALTNGCKHAFPNHCGRIVVEVRQTAPGRYALSVMDDGVGLAPNAPDGLGGELLSAFARQLGGELTRSTGLEGRGLCVGVEFPTSR